MTPPVIAWLTDFGTRDHYVGTMKAVVLSILPSATFVDITHDIAPQDVLGGALELAACYRYFPAGTTFVTIVDPAVGSGRRALAVRAGGYTFVAPDNGVLTAVLRELEAVEVVELTERRFQLRETSRTFEGRDRFAPAAAWLALGATLSEMGPVASALVMLDVPEPRVTPDSVRGEVVRVDRFGNAITNIKGDCLESWRAGARAAVEAGGASLGPLVATYADVAPGTACALISSSGHLEIAVSGGNAASRLGLGRGSVVLVTREVS